MALNKRCAPLIFNTFVKPFFRLIRFDNLLFLIILIGVMEKWVVAPIMNHFLLPEPLLWWHLLLLIVAVVCIAAGGYVINDYFDVKIDRINHPDELVVTRDVSKEQAMHLFYGSGDCLGRCAKHRAQEHRSLHGFRAHSRLVVVLFGFV